MPNINRQQIATEVENAIRCMAELLGSFDQDAINEAATAYSWTPAQVVKHILMSIENAPTMLQGPVAPTDRDPEEKVDMLCKIFTDHSTKMKSPEFIDPPRMEYQKAELIGQLETSRTAVGDALRSLDLSLTCTQFDLPGIGPMTRAEWGFFMMYHIKRHTQQLELMAERIDRSSSLSASA